MNAKIISLPGQKYLIAKSLYFCKNCGRVLLDVAEYLNEDPNNCAPETWTCDCGQQAEKVKHLFYCKI